MDKWTIYNKTGDFSGIARRFGISEITARLLVNRGLSDFDSIESYLNPGLGNLFSPHLLKNADKAAGLLAEQIKKGTRIRIVGDYDVDGVTATYILYDALSTAKALVDWYIPHRIRDGYGLNEDIIRSSAEDGIELIITCDNGIAATAAAEEAKRLGIGLIVTDHHEAPEVLPPADIIVDPKQVGDEYPCHDICGAVVAAKFAMLLFEKLEIKADISRYLEFMALATVCDVVSLQGENRTIAKLGMEALKHTSNPGLKALLAECEINKEMLSEYHLGYVLGPCLNATGRIDDAGLALQLLLAGDDESAHKIARECRELNEERKLMTAEQEKIAFSKLDSLESLPNVIVLELENCHESILGILAGRIKEKYNRPTIVVTKSGDNYKGSARSIPAYNMFMELSSVSNLLIKFGGHPMAAGLSLKEENVGRLRDALNSVCSLSEADMCRKFMIDAEISFNLFDEKAIEELNLLAPFGQNNPTVMFAERNLQVLSMHYMGKDNSFLRFRLRNRFGHEFSAISFLTASEVISEFEAAFGQAEVTRALNGASSRICFTAAYVPRINEFRDIREIQMNIKAIRCVTG